MVYLYHFDKPYRHAQHYLGSTDRDLALRDKEHRTGRGSPLVKAALDRGYSLTLIALYPDEGRGLERAIKLQKNSRRICPICSRSN